MTLIGCSLRVCDARTGSGNNDSSVHLYWVEYVSGTLHRMFHLFLMTLQGNIPLLWKGNLKLREVKPFAPVLGSGGAGIGTWAV